MARGVLAPHQPLFAMRVRSCALPRAGREFTSSSPVQAGERVADVAIYRLEITAVGRSAGRRATAAAAYRAGERIRDERSGRVYNYSRRTDVVHKEILLPGRFDVVREVAGPSQHNSVEALRAAGTPGATWARDRSALWNLAERAEKLRNSRVAREYQVALPFELAPAQRLGLVRAFARDIADRYNVAVDLTIHAPRAGGDSRNHHAHLLTTTREVTPDGLAAKSELDLRESERRRRGLVSSSQEFRALRARWAAFANQALREAGVEARIDHRTLEAQEIDRAPRAYLPWEAYLSEQRGSHSEIAERIRERVREKYRARVAMRLAQTVEPAFAVPGAHPALELPGASRMEADSRRAAQEWARLYGSSGTAIRTEDVRRQAAQDWLRLRSGRSAEPVEAGPSARDRRRAREHERQANLESTRHGRDDDFAL